LVTGDEADHWLVQTVAALVLADAAVLLYAARRERPSMEALILGLGAAIALTCIDVIYVARGTISAVYLTDAAMEGAFILGWIACLVRWNTNDEGARTKSPLPPGEGRGEGVL
jgi:hypothetical protein